CSECAARPGDKEAGEAPGEASRVQGRSIRPAIGSGGPSGKKRRAISAVAIAAIVPQTDADSVVGRMPAGSTEPAAARSAITVGGNKVMLAVLIARDKAIALVAVPGCVLSLSSSCIARVPN